MADLGQLSWYSFLFVWLFAVMPWLSFSVVRHADGLAVLLGEPYGTLILTLAVISIEVVMIVAVMMTGEGNPTLARDTMFAVLMIVLAEMLGLALLLGAWRHGEPAYNLQGANAYLGVLIPLAVLTLVLPRFTPSTAGGEVSPELAIFLIIESIVLYGVFLGIQTMRHRHFFVQPGADEEEAEEDHHDFEVLSVGYHSLFLIACIVPIVLLSKSMAKLMDHGIAYLEAPQALGGFLVAILVLAPEGLAAMKAALANRLQRAVNISLGSALDTIGLTVPAVLVIGLFTGQTVALGLDARR